MLKEEKTIPSVVIISMRLGGHAAPSGYDRLADYIPCDIVAPPVEWSFSQRAVARVCRPFISAAGCQWYHRDSFIAELNAAMKLWAGRRNIFHFLYGENSYNYLGRLKSPRSRKPIICTYHTPEEQFNQIVRDVKPIGRLDAVIVVSNVQRNIFTDLIGPERVHYIPHGIDVAYFKPPEIRQENDRPQCLFVGSHMRDFDVLVATIRTLQTSNIEFIIVTKKSQHWRFADLGNVTLFDGIDDNHLLRLYQSCDVLALPTTDTTATNSLMEAIACGLPVIATDLPETRDYVDESCAILCKKGDARTFAEGVAHLCEDNAARSRLGDACRQRALSFRWESVGEQVMQLYRQLL